MQVADSLDLRDDKFNARSAELRLGGFSLLVPHECVHSIEPILDVDMDNAIGASVGAITVSDHRWPVYCLDHALEILERVPVTRRSCVLLRAGGDAFGVLCDDVNVMDNVELRIVPVPSCMQDSASPVDALAVLGPQVACVLSVERVAALLRASGPLDDPGAGTRSTFVAARD